MTMKTTLIAALLFVAVFPATLTAQNGLSPIIPYWDKTPGSKDFVLDFTNDPVVAELDRAGRLFEDNIFNKIVVNLVYASQTGRLYGRSIAFSERADPVDQSMTRTPEITTSGKYERPGLLPWALIGQNGARSQGPNGAMHYGAGIQYHAIGMNDGTVAMCLSTAPGVDSETRYSGHNDVGQHLVCQVLIMPNGDTVFGYNTDPAKPARFFFQGDLYFGGKMLSFTGDAWSHVNPSVGKPGEDGRASMKKMLAEQPK